MLHTHTTHTHTHKYLQAHKYACIYTHTYSYHIAWVSTYSIKIRTYVHTYIHTHTYIRTHRNLQQIGSDGPFSAHTSATCVCMCMHIFAYTCMLCVSLHEPLSTQCWIRARLRKCMLTKSDTTPPQKNDSRIQIHATRAGTDGHTNRQISHWTLAPRIPQCHTPYTLCSDASDHPSNTYTLSKTSSGRVLPHSAYPIPHPPNHCLSAHIQGPE